MGTSYNPKIVTNGLVLNLDAGNKKSYPGTGTNWTDLRAKNNSVLSNVTYSSDNAGIFSYNGTSSTTVSSTAIGSVSEFTVCVWFKTNAVANYNNVLDLNYGFHTNPNVGPRLEMAADGSLTWLISGNTSSGGVYTLYKILSSGLQANVWYHIAITRSSTPTVNTYLNGFYRQSSRTDSSNADAFTGTFNKVTTGVGWSGRYHNGYISNLICYNRSLTASEILQNYNATRGRFGV